MQTLSPLVSGSARHLAGHFAVASFGVDPLGEASNGDSLLK